MENLDVDILAGVPFTDMSDITVRTSRRQVTAGDHHTWYYGSAEIVSTHHTVRRAQSYVLRAPT